MVENHEARRDKQRSINIAEYLQQVRRLGEEHRVETTEVVPVEDALGRVLAESVVAKDNVPMFANSAMDGYAVRYADLETFPIELSIAGEQPAGPRRDLLVQEGQAVRIMTGASLPAGADTVVQSELTEESGAVVRILESVRSGANVRHPGEDVAAGEQVLPRGTRLGARQLSAAAAAGSPKLDVYRRVRVGVLSTGDELVPPGSSLGPGQIYESNSFLLGGLAQEAGAEVERQTAVADTPEALASALDELASSCDAMLLSGGVSVGRFDVVRNLLDGAEDAHFHRVALQPGKPQGRAIWKGVPLLAFPGNPVGAFVSFYVFGRPFLRAIGGELAPGRPRRRVTAGAGWKAPEGRTQYVPGELRTSGDGTVVFVPSSRLGSGSHLVTSLAKATSLAVIPAKVESVAEGDIIDVEDIW